MKGLVISSLTGVLLTACLQEELATQPLEPAALVTVTARQVRFNGEPIETQPTTFAAYQQGDGPWQALPLRDGEYSVEVEEGRYAMAMGMRSLDAPSSMRTFLQITHATTDETREITFHQDFAVATPYRLLVDVRGVNTGERATLTLDRTTSFLENGVHTIAHDKPEGELFVVLQRVLSGQGPTAEYLPRKIFRIGRVNLLDSGPVVVDFQLPLAGALAFPATVDGDDFSMPVQSTVRTQRGSISLARKAGVFYALPPSLAHPTDLAGAGAGLQGGQGEAWRSVSFTPLAPGPQVLEFAPPFAMPAPTLLLHPYVRPAFPLIHVPLQLEVTDYEYEIWSSSEDEHRSIQTAWAFLFSDGWISSAAMPRYEAPVFNGLPGWSIEMAPLPEAAVGWRTSRVDLNTREPGPGQLRLSTSTNGLIGN